MDHDRVEPDNQEQGQKVAEDEKENLKDMNNILLVTDAKCQI